MAQHWHCFALLPQIYICYTWYSQKFCRRPFPIKRNGRFAVKVVVIIVMKKIRRILQDEHAEANYFSTMVFIFIAVLLLAFIIDLFSIISTKQELDLCADQMVKQIQLSGGVNAETEQLFNFLCSQIGGADNISYSINASYKTPRIPMAYVLRSRVDKWNLIKFQSFCKAKDQVTLSKTGYIAKQIILS